jgi:hypothetical protein
MSIARRRLAVLPLVLLAGAVCCGAFGVTGASALSLTTCTGTNSVTYSPPLTNTLTTTRITDQSTFGTCLSTQSGIRSATIANGTVTGPSSCTAVLGSFSTTNTIVWNTGQTSRFDFDGTVTEVDGEFVIVLTGSITAGLFSGATATEQTTLLGDLTACGGSGLASNSGPSVLTIVRL